MSGLNDGVLNREKKADLETYGPKIQELQQARASAVAADGEEDGAGVPGQGGRREGRDEDRRRAW